jgi:hypothetical protein
MSTPQVGRVDDVVDLEVGAVLTAHALMGERPSARRASTPRVSTKALVATNNKPPAHPPNSPVDAPP